jgi:SAM-dependent methyltransferase
MSCCERKGGFADVFTDDSAKKDADRYRRRGLPPRAQRLVAAIEATTPLEGSSLLEIGVGAGAVTIELLKRGAARAVGVDAVAAQLAAARSLATDMNVADRLEFVLGDFTATADLVQNADVVILDRVVCCYPDWRTLLGAAASRAQSAIALTYPRDVWWMRLVARSMNLWWRLLRSEFRFHVHPVHELHALVASQGLTPRVHARYFAWEVMAARRG